MDAAINPSFTLVIGGEEITTTQLADWIDQHVSSDSVWLNHLATFLQDWLNSDSNISVQTSGSTGKPKTIQLEKSRMVISAKKTNYFFELTENSSALLALSASYIAGKMMIVRALVGGYALHAVEPQSNPLAQVTEPLDFAPLVPMQVLPFLGQEYPVKTILLGGAPVPNQYVSTLEAIEHTAYYLSFGMTETISHIALRALNGSQASSHFHCLEGVHVAADDRGYLIIDAPELADEAIHTNDVVNILNNREFEWLGRADFIINSGGVKIHPEQVEKKLAPHIQLPYFIWKEQNDRLHEQVVLLIESESTIQPDLYKTWFKDLAPFEKPKAIYSVLTFSYTNTGKIKRSETFVKALKDGKRTV